MNPILEYLKIQKIENYDIANTNVIKGETLFTGSSLMEHFPINEILMNHKMHNVLYNRGIGGFTTLDMLQNMSTQIFDLEPSKIFINIGTNDIGDASRSFDEVLSEMLLNYENILNKIKLKLPNTKVYLMAYYPVNEVDKVPPGPWGETMFVNRNNINLAIANTSVQNLANKFNYTYIDVNNGLTDESGKLKKEFTVEGVHMYPNAYEIIFQNLKSFL